MGRGERGGVPGDPQTRPEERLPGALTTVVGLGVEKIGENLDEQKGLARRRGKEAPFVSLVSCSM